MPDVLRLWLVKHFGIIATDRGSGLVAELAADKDETTARQLCEFSYGIGAELRPT
jgi:hypothetical protein